MTSRIVFGLDRSTPPMQMGGAGFVSNSLEVARGWPRVTFGIVVDGIEVRS